MVVLKVETDIIASLAASLIVGIMYEETFKTDVVFISNVIMCLMSHWHIILRTRTAMLILTISTKGNVTKLPINFK